MAKAVSFKLDADMKSMMQGFQDMLRGIEANNKKMVELTKNIGQASRRLDQTGRTGGNTFGAIESSLTGLITRFASVGAAVGGVNKILGTVRDVAKQAAEQIKSLHDAYAAMAQVTDTPEELGAATLKTQIAALQTGTSLEEAAALGFQSYSVSLKDYESLVKAASASQISANPAEIMTSVGKYRAAFPEEDFTVRQLISGLGAAGGPSDIRMDVMGQAALKSLGFIKAIGGSAAETLAVPSVLSKQFESPETAGTAIARLADEVGKAGYTSEGLMGGLARWKKEDPTGYAEKIASESNALRAARAIETASEEIRKRTQEIEHAISSGATYDKLIRLSESETLAPALQAKRMDILKQLMDQDEGSAELKYQNTITARDYFLKQQGVGLARRKATEWVNDAEAFLFGPKFATKDIETGMQLSSEQLIKAAQDDMTARMLKSLEAIERNTARTGDNTASGPELAPRGSVGAEMRPRE